MKPQASPDKAKRQCWECLKRRLVCDHSLPHCKKCIKAGKDCPGYDEQKPLQWVTPGKVTSRRRNKVACPKQLRRVSKPQNAPKTPNAARNGVMASEKDALETGVERTFYIQERVDITDRLEKEASTISRLEKLFKWLQMEEIPRYEMLTETSEVVQAVHYYNTNIYPHIRGYSILAPNPHIIHFPQGALHLLPPAMHHIMVCLAVNHRMNSLPAGASRQFLGEKWSKVYHHRGAAIRDLSEHIGKVNTRSSDTTMSSVLMFMCAELQQSTSGNWRTHADGLIQLINLRGGLMSLYREKVYLQPGLTIFILIAIFSNTTSPPNDQIDIFPPTEQSVSEIEEIYHHVFPYCLCPPPLFLELVRVNNLRACAACLPLHEIDHSLVAEAKNILARIEAFSPEDWAQSSENYDDFLLLGALYQSAITVYCISSLQSLAILTLSPRLISTRATHADRLFVMLRLGAKLEHVKAFIMWPLVVAGAEAAYKGEGTRSWIESELSEASRYNGTGTPLKARALLRRYWAREERGWDECFDRVYCFTA